MSISSSYPPGFISKITSSTVIFHPSCRFLSFIALSWDFNNIFILIIHQLHSTPMLALFHPPFEIQLTHASFRKPPIAPKLVRCLLWVSLLSGLITLPVLPQHSPDTYLSLVNYLSSSQYGKPRRQSLGLLLTHGSVISSESPLWRSLRLNREPVWVPRSSATQPQII